MCLAALVNIELHGTCFQTASGLVFIENGNKNPVEVHSFQGGKHTQI